MLFEIPGYQILEKISESEAFKIYRGQRSKDRFPVLLKVLDKPYPAPKFFARFWQEYEILRHLDLPGVEKAYALENHGPRWMIVLEDYGGLPLDRLRIAGRMEAEDYLNLALQLAEIVGEIHDRQVVHKNISPANIVYNPSTRQARLVNFGYASLISSEKAALQSTYKLAGSLAYISPEMTGRMNRSVDYRADYYSLGATLYELLTGTPPFKGETPLELVHAHLALLADPPAARIAPWSASPTAFQILSCILLKLLSKNPEERYQTPGALQADLCYCLSVLQEPEQKGLENVSFIPGQVDRSVDLLIQQVVLGREKETEVLNQALLRTIGGPAELVLVSGEAGVGKTTLVNQLVRPVTEQMGLFISAKYDQVRHQDVYQALRQVLEEFCWLVLSEPTPTFIEWQVKVQAAVEPHGKLLTSLCPQLEKVIGPQLPVDPVDEELARSRLHQVVIRFLQAVCQPGHPVVIFLDDLQWINPDSLLLWQSILATPSLQNLLVVGAYRDDEVGLGHPLHRWVDESLTAQVNLSQLKLQNLGWTVIRKLVAAALASNPIEVSELTTLVFLRTEGNPYFTNEFLNSLYKDRLLVFNLDEQKWRWDADRIEGYSVASNVVDLFVREITKLNEDTQKTLQYAALIGRRFDVATLLALFGPDKAQSLAVSLWQAMTESLIQPLDENYRFLAVEPLEGFMVESGEEIPSLAALFEEEILFEFQHDRVQQAALVMLEEQQLKLTSLQMGWLLLEKAEREGHEVVQESLLPIVDHLNRGSALIEDPMEAIKLAQLNLMASNQARAVAAFDTAYSYLSTGMQILPENSWQDQYILTLELFTAAAEVVLLNGDLARAEVLAMEAEANARSPLEKVRIMKILMEIYLTQTRTGDVIELGMAAIKMLGFNLGVREPPAFIGEQIMQLPAMTDPRALAISSLAEPFVTVLFGKNDPRLAQLIYFYIDLFFQFGNPPVAGYIYITYGALILLGQFEQVEQGCLMGRLALELAEKGGTSKTLFIVRFVYYSFVHHWLEPAREAIGPLYENIQPAFESGNLRYFITSQDLVVQISLFVGRKLEEVRSKQAEALRRLALLKQVGYTQRLRIWSQFVLKLIGELQNPLENIGELFDGDEAQTLIEGGQNPLFLFNMYVSQAYLSLLFRNTQRALESSTLAHGIKLEVRSQLNFAQHQFIYSLALLSAGLEAGDQATRLEKVDENLRLMRLWAERVPENFLHQLELVEAEKARCLGREHEAAERYERAIQEARENGYIHESALAAELAAEFYLAQEDDQAAKDHLFTAYFSYLAWGAQAKVADLVRRYPEWLPPEEDEHKREISSKGRNDKALDEISSSIDLNTILRSSLELAQETDLEELLRKLMSILIQNAGAQNGSLIIYLDERWFIEVQGSTDPEDDFALLSIPLDEQATQVGEPLVPTSIIHYVINSQESLVLEGASTSFQFSQDAYFQIKHPKSVLCAPLLNQGILGGVVYLENNLVAGAFTPDRVQIVQLISSQAAVSMEKARLYENLESLVEERTRELSEANRKLKEEIDERNRVEESLRLSEERYRAVVNTQTEAVCRFQPDTTLTFVNEAYCRFVEKTTEELIGQSFLITLPHEYHETIRDIVRGMLEHRGILENELQIVGPSGKTRWQHWVNTPIIEHGEVVEFQAVGFDITERKLAEEALRYSETLLKKVLEVLPTGVWILDQDGKILSGNPEAQRIWSGAKYVDPQEFGEYKAWRVDTGQPVSADEWAGGLAVRKGQITLNEELEIQAFDGTRRTILNSALPLMIEKDRSAGAIVVNQDITRRKQDEKELQTAHGQLSTLLQVTQSIVSTLDLDRLLNLIIEQLGNVLPYHGAAILILEGNYLEFRVIRGPEVLQNLFKHPIPVNEPTLIKPLVTDREVFYLPDLQADGDLLSKIQAAIKITYDQFANLKSWLGIPLIARDELVGILVLTHSQPDYYPFPSRNLARVFANQVAIAIQNAQLYQRAQDVAALEERNRLSRELHDSVAQTLYSISLFTNATQLALATQKLDVVKTHLDELDQLSREALADMRLMIFELRPPVLEKEGLLVALQSRLDSVEARAGFKTKFYTDGNLSLTPEEEGELYRIAQEALNNILKHAEANQVSVYLTGEGRDVRLVVADDGVGFDPATVEDEGGQGIRNIRERAEHIGATCLIDSTPGRGTKIIVEVKK